MTCGFIVVSLSLIAALHDVQGSKILVVFPMPAYSHHVLGFRLAKELADKGHEVTLISPYPQKTPLKNFRDIAVTDHIKFFENLKKQLFEVGGRNPIRNANRIFRMGEVLTENTYNHPDVQKLLNSEESFDLVILEYFLNDGLAGFAHHFKAPLLLMSSTSSTSCNHLFANPAPSSYVPLPLSNLPKNMTFFQRIQNGFFTFLLQILREMIFMPTQRKLFKTYIKTDLELEDILYNASLVLTNSHVSVNDAVPKVPSIIEIGGFHVYPPKKLPADLQKFLDDATDGVILFSMGSNLKSKDLNLEVRTSILAAFSKIKQKVLWKFEDELPDLPPNVEIMKWVPQQDVLAHPNIKAFISHGGLLSTIETVYHGVPIIGIPVFGDQKSNIAAAANNGYAINLPLDEITEEALSRALHEILNNPKYRENVQQRSKLMTDRPMKPIDEAVYWVEHVIRHKGAPHLRSAGLDLRWYQRNMLDITLFLLLVAVLLFTTFYIILKNIIKRCRGKKVKISTIKKKN